MTMKEVVEHFGTKAGLAKALGITPQAVTLWGDRVPELRQYQIQSLTRGALKVD